MIIIINLGNSYFNSNIYLIAASCASDGLDLDPTAGEYSLLDIEVLSGDILGDWLESVNLDWLLLYVAEWLTPGIGVAGASTWTLLSVSWEPAARYPS